MLWNQSTSEFHLPLIAARIDDWRSISPCLGLSAADDSAILGESPHSVPTQRVAMLRRWKQKQGEKATYKELYRVFRQCERADLADFVQQLVTETDSSKESELTSIQTYKHILHVNLLHVKTGSSSSSIIEPYLACALSLLVSV